MVEGPGATRNAGKMQPAVGCLVVPMGGEQQPQSTEWIGTTLVETFCVGKEVFLVFSNDAALRLHFGMNGSLALARNGKPVVQRYAKRQPATIQMKFQTPDGSSGFLLECFSTSSSNVTANAARSKRERLQSLDACSPDTLFVSDLVMAAIRKRPAAMICDAVLDQSIFPGIGNIIKIEGLHQAKINPKRLVSSLSDNELQTAIRQCRQYARAWLKAGRAPPKKVYNETTCKSCQTFGSVRMVKLGCDLSRVTFWCEKCQPFNPSMLTISADDKSQHNVLKEVNRTSLNPLASAKPTHSPSSKTMCPQHGLSSLCIRRVRHKEQNRHRLFGACKVKGCPFFAWADAHLPNCSKCQKKTILRVSKKEQSGGRWFLSCSTCSGTFAWATSHQLAPLGKFLTPLL